MTYALGDHLMSSRFGYTHHGIYIGDDKVIHYSGLAEGLNAGPIEITTLEAFAAGRKIRVRRYRESKYSGAVAVERAHTRLNEDRYDLQANNCEHFCTWVRTGHHVSSQVQVVEAATGAIAAGLSEFRKQRFHDATATETAVATGKAVTRALAKSTGILLPLNPLKRLLK
jgi:hypothetical protein